MEMIVFTLFGLMIDKSTAELQSPRTSAPSSLSSFRITLPGKYLFSFLFINYIYELCSNHCPKWMDEHFSSAMGDSQGKLSLLQSLRNLQVLNVLHRSTALRFRCCSDCSRRRRKALRSFSFNPLSMCFVSEMGSILSSKRVIFFRWILFAGESLNLASVSYYFLSLCLCVCLKFDRKAVALEPLIAPAFFSNSCEQSMFCFEGTKKGFSTTLLVTLRDLLSALMVGKERLDISKLGLKSTYVQSCQAKTGSLALAVNLPLVETILLLKTSADLLVSILLIWRRQSNSRGCAEQALAGLQFKY